MATPTPARPPRRRSLLGLFLALTGLAFVVVVLLLALFSLAAAAHRSDAGLGRDRIGVITIQGVISNSSDSSLLGGRGGASVGQLVEFIRNAAQDESIKAVVLRINSPGGSAGGAQEVYETVQWARKAYPAKRFVASLGDMAASGGYYIAAGCDRIVANRATATGSIGVVIPGFDLSGLLQWIRVKPDTIKSGRYKDTGSGYRPMAPDERELLQGIVDNTYRQFLGDVARGRGMDVEKVRPLADGRLFTGEQALEYGLVDRLGGFYDAVDLARELVHLKRTRKPNLYRYGDAGFLDQLLKSQPAAPGPQLLASQGLPPLWLISPVGAPLAAAGAVLPAK